MRDQTLKVFVSATTQDLGLYRTAIKEELLTAGILPITQENFSPDYRSLLEFLRLEISKCDVVICLIGFFYGAEPEGNADSRRSYTQIEYEFAIEYNKPIFPFLMDEAASSIMPVSESHEKKELQLRHRTRIMEAGHKWELFSDIEDLKVKVARAIRKIEKISAQSPIFYRHLPKRPSYFAGRTMEKKQLQNALLQRSPSVIVVIGMGGQGKTTLVNEALLDQEGFPFRDGFWCTAYRGGFTFDMFLDDALSYLMKQGFDKRDMPDVNSRVSRLLGLLQKEPILLVIDGIERWLSGWNSGKHDMQFAETVHERASFHAGLDEFLQEASGLVNGTHLVLTSRALPAALDHAVRSQIPVREELNENLGLEGLDPAASVELLQQLGIKGTPEQLKNVAESYDNHPLALIILAALLKKKYGGQLDRLPYVTPLDPRQELYKLFDEIRVNLPSRESAERFLKIAAHCIENPSLQVIAAGMAENKARDDGIFENLVDQAVILADWNLVWWNGTTQTVSLHPLVKFYFGSLDGEKESRDTHNRLSKWYGDLTIPNHVMSLEGMSPRILAIKHATRAGDLFRAADLMFIPLSTGNSLFTWLGEWGHQFAAIEILQELADSAGDELRGHFLLARAQMFQHLARPQRAIEHVEEAISIFEKLSTNGSNAALANLAKSLASRGTIHRDTGSSKVAILDFNRAVEIFKVIEYTAFDSRLDLAKTLVNRGNALRGSGALSQAILDYDSAAELWEKLRMKNVDWDESLSVPTFTNRGIAFLGLGKIDLAISDFEESIATCTQQQGYRAQEIARLLAHGKSMMGVALRVSGQYGKALNVSSEAVQTLQDLVDRGRNDSEPFLALTFINRSKIFIEQEQWSDALQDCDNATLIYQRLVVEAGSHFRFLSNNCGALVELGGSQVRDIRRFLHHDRYESHMSFS